MEKKSIEEIMALADMIAEDWPATLVISSCGIPGEDALLLTSGDHDANTRNWTAFLLNYPDYLSIIFRAINTIFLSPEIETKDKLPVMDSFKENMQHVTEALKIIRNEW